MKNRLDSKELINLIESVFSPGPEDKHLAILIDIPDDVAIDTVPWSKRRAMAVEWVEVIGEARLSLGLESVHLVGYANVHSNNADLPAEACIIDPPLNPVSADDLASTCEPKSFKDILSNHSIILAPTEFSATAPLKLMAKTGCFRAATMPGFSEEMIPALRLDYAEINRRVLTIKQKLDGAERMHIEFSVKDAGRFTMVFDLRQRKSHASGGRFPHPGVAGNIPGGECYIVPYEGEGKRPSETNGTLPVQFDEEVVLYKIEKNKAIAVLSRGPYSEAEESKIREEPAYANLAEVGFGVLRDFGIKPTGRALLDEKLGLHIAFGRSDHFGGSVGVKDFTSPDRVIHIDRIYIPETQKKVTVEYVDLIDDAGRRQNIMSGGMYTLFI